MNFKLKTLLVFAGALLLAVPGGYAQRAGGGGRAGGFSGGRASFAGRPAANASAFRGSAGRGGLYRSGSSIRPYRGGGYYGGRGNYYRGGGYRHGYGRYYYLGGIPYFYPFYGYGFGYPSYYGGFYGDGFYGDDFYGGAGSEGAGYADRAYEGRISDRNARGGSSNRGGGDQLPAAVQRQLAKKGYYRGKIDGQFGPASREALTRFQKSEDIKETGRIDEDTLEALGFTDER